MRLFESQLDSGPVVDLVLEYYRPGEPPGLFRRVRAYLGFAAILLSLLAAGVISAAGLETWLPLEAMVSVMAGLIGFLALDLWIFPTPPLVWILKLPDESSELYLHPHGGLNEYQVFVNDGEIGFAKAGEPVDELEYIEINSYWPDTAHRVPVNEKTAPLLEADRERISRKRQTHTSLQLDPGTTTEREHRALRVENTRGEELLIPSFFPLDEIEAELERRTDQISQSANHET